MREALEDAAQQQAPLCRGHLTDMHGIDIFEVDFDGLGRLAAGELEDT